MKYPKKHGVCINRKRAYVRSAAKTKARDAYEYYCSPVARLETQYLRTMATLAYTQHMLSVTTEEWAYGYASDEEVEQAQAEVEITEVEMGWLAKELRNHR